MSNSGLVWFSLKMFRKTRRDLKVLGKIRSSVNSRYCCSQGYLNSLIFSRRGKRAKFMEPMLQEASSGLQEETIATLCSGVIPRPPPVVVQTTMSHLLLILVMIFLKI